LTRDGGRLTWGRRGLSGGRGALRQLQMELANNVGLLFQQSVLFSLSFGPRLLSPEFLFQQLLEFIHHVTEGGILGPQLLEFLRGVQRGRRVDRNRIAFRVGIAVRSGKGTVLLSSLVEDPLGHFDVPPASGTGIVRALICKRSISANSMSQFNYSLQK